MTTVHDIKWLKAHRFEDANVDLAFEKLHDYLNSDSVRTRMMQSNYPGITNADKIYFLAPTRCRIMNVYFISDTATAGASSAAYHLFTLAKNPFAASIAAVSTNNNGNIVAQQKYNIYSDEIGSEMAENDILRISVSVVGAPTNLTVAHILYGWEYLPI